MPLVTVSPFKKIFFCKTDLKIGKNFSGTIVPAERTASKNPGYSPVPKKSSLRLKVTTPTAPPILA